MAVSETNLEEIRGVLHQSEDRERNQKEPKKKGCRVVLLQTTAVHRNFGHEIALGVGERREDASKRQKAKTNPLHPGKRWRMNYHWNSTKKSKQKLWKKAPNNITDMTTRIRNRWMRGDVDKWSEAKTNYRLDQEPLIGQSDRHLAYALKL